MTTRTDRDEGDRCRPGPVEAILAWIGRSVYRFLLVVAIVWIVGVIVGLFVDGGPGGGATGTP